MSNPNEIIRNFIKTINNLNQVADSVGGSGWSPPELRDMSALDLVISCSCNGIGFINLKEAAEKKKIMEAEQEARKRAKKAERMYPGKGQYADMGPTLDSLGDDGFEPEPPGLPYKPRCRYGHRMGHQHLGYKECEMTCRGKHTKDYEACREKAIILKKEREQCDR